MKTVRDACRLQDGALCVNWHGDMTQRALAVEVADFLAHRLEELRPEEASAARVLRELVKNQRLG